MTEFDAKDVDPDDYKGYEIKVVRTNEGWDYRITCPLSESMTLPPETEELTAPQWYTTRAEAEAKAVEAMVGHHAADIADPVQGDALVRKVAARSRVKLGG